MKIDTRHGSRRLLAFCRDVGGRLLIASTVLLALGGSARPQDVIDLGPPPDTAAPIPEEPPQPPAAPLTADQAPATEPTGTAIPPSPDRIANPVAVFAGLDKITGRITSFDVYIDETVQFGSLQVTPRVCYNRPLTDAPRTDAFVEVDEIGLDRKVRRIFTGWMFADSPGLHAVDNPVYDVWLTDCKMQSNVPLPKK